MWDELSLGIRLGSRADSMSGMKPWPKVRKLVVGCHLLNFPSLYNPQNAS